MGDAQAELEAAHVVQAAHADAQAALAAAAARRRRAPGRGLVPSGTGGVHEARLLHAVRTLDTASSLSQTLDALFTATAHAEARRVAVFSVRGEALRARNHAGFDSVPGGSTFDLPLGEAGFIADAVRAGLAPACRRQCRTSGIRGGVAGGAPGGGAVMGERTR